MSTKKTINLAMAVNTLGSMTCTIKEYANYFVENDFNTVGPRQTGEHEMVIPRSVKQALNGGPLTVYGDGKQTRCFLHVNDCVEAIIALMDNSKAIGKIYNVGSQDEVTIENLAKKVIELTGKKTGRKYISQKHTLDQILINMINYYKEK